MGHLEILLKSFHILSSSSEQILKRKDFLIFMFSERECLISVKNVGPGTHWIIDSFSRLV